MFTHWPVSSCSISVCPVSELTSATRPSNRTRTGPTTTSSPSAARQSVRACVVMDMPRCRRARARCVGHSQAFRMQHPDGVPAGHPMAHISVTLAAWREAPEAETTRLLAGDLARERSPRETAVTPGARLSGERTGAAPPEQALSWRADRPYVPERETIEKPARDAYPGSASAWRPATEIVRCSHCNEPSGRL